MNFVKKNLIYLVLLIGLGAIAFLPGVRKIIFPVAEIESHLHIPAEDYDIKLKGINTASTNLKDFRGKKILFLNFWGTWCKPCREEWPSIEKLYHAKNGQMDFVLIAMMDDEEKVRKFIMENNYKAPVYLAETPISNTLLPKVFPTTFILDKTGRILQKETSSKDWNSKNSHQFLEKVSQP